MSGRFDSPLKTNQQGRRLLYKRVATENGHGTRAVQCGSEDYLYEVNIDWADVRQMAAKAADSKGGKSGSGPIQVRIVSRTTTMGN